MTIQAKLEAIRIQNVEFRSTTLCDALAYLHHCSYAADPDTENPQAWGVPVTRLVDDPTAADLRVTLTIHDATLSEALCAVADAAGLGVYLNESGAVLLPLAIGHQLDTMRDEARKARIQQLGTPPEAYIPGLPRDPGYRPVAACRAVLARVRQNLGV